MQSRKDFYFNPLFNFGTETPFVIKNKNGGSPTPGGVMLFEDGVPMLYEDGTYMIYE